MTFGKIAGFPELHVLDSTDPAQVKAFENKIDLAKHAVHRLEQVGLDARAQHLQAVLLRPRGRRSSARRKPAAASSPSPIPARRCSRSPRATASATSSSAGRASAGATRRSPTSAWCRRRSWASTWPSSSIGPRRWSRACMPSVPVEENPGVVLGTILGVAAKQFGRDKVTIVASPGIADLGAWLEQLLAESTGKDGKGIDPDRSRAARRARGLRQRSAVRLPAAAVGARCGAGRSRRRARAGRPPGRAHRGRRCRTTSGEEFFRWEIATAVAGSILGIHPFDQPDVEASKIATRKLTAEYERDRRAAGRDADLRRRRHQALHRRDERGGVDAARRRTTDAGRLSRRRTSAGSAPATTSRCSPTSR